MPGLGTTARLAAIDLEDPVHPGEHDRQPALDRDGAPDSPVPAPRGTTGTRCSRRQADELGDLGRPRRQGDREREAGGSR